ncbi:MAG TPA: polyprenyl synthetase family protein [Thermoanaerobaculia bacterium]|nr:polyprenyl synthetase family protein [Thermoanaerobaculia bacterium]HUM30750.1 polyprenyl synthetase family protein [Thermoanaerobaculia bacterium]HXK68961.1 polyprenyl synthetase family protein [Thermoanaerobaculia bacterium]
MRTAASLPVIKDFLPLVQEVENFLINELSEGPQSVREAATYMAGAGGKRLRPALMLAVSRLLDVDRSKVIPMAAAVEWLHTATLIHDDIIDDAELRRGKPALYKIMGHNVSVLVGDFLYALAIKEAVKTRKLAIIDILAETTVKMIEGEILALEHLCDPSMDEALYFDIITRKTAHLFATATTIPAHLNGSNPGQLRALKDYGTNFGIAFQMIDDMKDFTKSEAQRGKPVLQDLKEGKLTLPVLYLKKHVKGKERDALEAMMSHCDEARVDLFALVNQYDTLKDVKDLANSYLDRARAALTFFPDSPARTILMEAPDYILS